jgi:hypothetical protein
MAGDVWSNGVSRFDVLMYAKDTYFVHYLGATRATVVEAVCFQDERLTLYSRHGKRYLDNAALWESIYNKGIPKPLKDLTKDEVDLIRSLYGFSFDAFSKSGNVITFKDGTLSLPKSLTVDTVDMVVNKGCNSEVSISLWRKEE